MKIHNTAIVDPAASIGENVTVGPYAVIGKNVVIGDNCKIHSHAVLDGNTTFGPGCEIYPHASIGLQCQDLKYHGETTYVKIGANTVIRECVTINSATEEEGETVIGDNCFLMAYSHVAHNCVVGNGVIMANCVSLAGHITIGEKAILGGLAAVHQFVHIGAMAMVGGLSKVSQDVPPYALSDGQPCTVRDINAVGLKRNGVNSEDRLIIRRAFKILFKSGLNTKHALERVQQELPATPYIDTLINFIQNSKRGIGR